jgi:aryl-alcohol dehydrogenase-like predicted oxidoreductase
MKLGLGTVQFGTDYGVSNRLGQTTPEEVVKILDFASESGITYLDTAPAYGNSEVVLGASLSPNHAFRIVTKTSKITQPKINAADVQLVIDDFHESLCRLQQSSVYGLLVHHPDDLLNEGGDRLMAGLKLLKIQGFVKKIGVSVYDREQVERLLDKFSVDLIQVPLNIFDQRLLKNNFLSHLKGQGIEIHVRSVFLQGILLMAEAELPPYLAEFGGYLRRYHQVNEILGLSALQAATGFIHSLPEVDAVLVGVNNLRQLREIIESAKIVLDTKLFRELSIEDETLINPSMWSK